MPPASSLLQFQRLRPLQLFSLAGLVGTMAIGGGSLFASKRAGEAEAMAEVRTLTHLVAKTVVEPNLSPELLAGDLQAIERLDQIVTGRVLDETTLRVKLWSADGQIVYSDEARLIGESYQLGDDETSSLWSGDIISEISDLEGQENRYEAAIADRLLEVYLPIDGPDGNPLLYESYFTTSEVSESAGRIRAEFAPIIVAALLLMAVLHLGLARRLNSTIERNQAERERLLQRAIDSSNIERRRIAADLHDGVVQDLVGASFAVSAAAESAANQTPELATDLRSAAIGTRRSLRSLRSLLVDIYPPNLHEQGLEAALVDLLAPAANLGITTELTIPADLDPGPDTTALVYRVVQESVRNVFRHANATSLTVSVEQEPDCLAATISDNGSGFSTDQVAGSGHLGLRLLADLTVDAGAGFVVDSKPGVGTTICLQVPA